MTRSTQRESLDWLVSKFANEVGGVSHAILVSADGLLMAASEGARRPAASALGENGVSPLARAIAADSSAIASICF